MKSINKYLILFISALTILQFYLNNYTNLGFLFLSLSFIFLFYCVTLNPSIFKIIITILLFLGIWVKYIVRSILTPGIFNDPIGDFIYSNDNISEIFIYVSLILVLIGFIFKLKFKYNKNFNFSKIDFDFKYQIIFIILIFLLILINYLFKIDYRGLNTHYTGAEIYLYKYLIHIFAPIFIFTFADKFLHENKYQFPFLSIFIFLYAISINSRSFVFDGFVLLIYFFIIFKNTFNLKKYVLFSIIYLTLAVINFYYVNSIRYSSFIESNNLQLTTKSNISEIRTYIKKTSENVGYYSLFIDRWVGLEPILAIYSYPKRSNETLLEAIFERKDSNISFYDKLIIKDSTYLVTNNDKIFYQNIPGIIGFSLYTDNFFISLLFIGFTFLFVIAMLGFISAGIFSTYIVSFLFAWRLSHFGYTPIHTLIYFILISLTYIFINKSLIWKR